MIGFLRGKVVAAELDGRLLVDVQGVGYEVSSPLGAVAAAPPGGDAQDVSLYIHTHVREDALDLFGFASAADRQLFKLLIGIPGVGPRTALGVLSAIPCDDLATAIDEGNVRRLTKVSGIGKKTAERLVLELKGKLKARPSVSAPATPDDDEDRDRLLGALTNMGYRGAEAERAVKGLNGRLGQAPLQDLLREALAILAG